MIFQFSGDWKCFSNWKKFPTFGPEFCLRLCMHITKQIHQKRSHLGEILESSMLGKQILMESILDWNIIWLIFFFNDDTQNLNGTLIGTDCDKQEPVPNVFLMSVVLFFGTFTTSIILKDFKTALFFPSKVSQWHWFSNVSHFLFINTFCVGPPIYQWFFCYHCDTVNDSSGLQHEHSNAKIGRTCSIQTNTWRSQLVDKSIYKWFLVVDNRLLPSTAWCHSHFYGSTNHRGYCESQRK